MSNSEYNNREMIQLCAFNNLRKEINTKVDHQYLSKLYLYIRGIDDIIDLINELHSKLNSMHLCRECKIHKCIVKTALGIDKECNSRYCTNSVAKMKYNDIMLKLYLSKLYFCIMCDNNSGLCKLIFEAPNLESISTNEPQSQMILLHSNIVLLLCSYPEIISIFSSDDGESMNVYIVSYIFSPFSSCLTTDDVLLKYNMCNSVKELGYDVSEVKDNDISPIVSNVVMDYCSGLDFEYKCKIEVPDKCNRYSVVVTLDKESISVFASKIKI